jgi:ABC-type multidrug transport system fused ATPase/permease subunit
MISANFENQILHIITNFSLEIPSFFKIIFLLFALVFIAAIIYFLKNSTWLRRIFLQDFIEFATFSSYMMGKITKTWRKITERLERGTEDEAKLAILEADEILNGTLNKIGYTREETLGEKLDEITSDTISNIEEIREVHKIRNNIIHDPDYRLNLAEAQRAIFIYEKALRDLEVL